MKQKKYLCFFLLAFLAFWGTFAGSVSSRGFAQETAPLAPPSLEKSYIVFRIGCNVWLHQDRFDQLLAFFDKYPGVTDEISFFTQPMHSPIRDDVYEEYCVILKDRMAQCREHGYRAGINLLCTIGHHSEYLDGAIGDEIPHAVDLNGKVAQGTLCMNDEINKERFRRIYRATANANPDFIWIDDDVRSGHMMDDAGNGGNLCYCDTCMKRLSKKFGRDMTREELQAMEKTPEVLAIMHQEVNDSINELFELIERTIHEIQPEMPLGFMTGERFYEGYDFSRWAKTLAGPNNTPVYWRPGGGFYEHSGIYNLVGKAHEIGRQNSRLPQEVEIIASEIENFPYQPLSKAKNVTALEGATYIATGCTGVAFNVLTNNEEMLDDYEPLIKTLSLWRPFYDLMVQHLGRSPLVGVHPLWDPSEINHPDGNPIHYFMPAISEAGIPIAYARGNSNVFLLSRGFVASHSKEFMREILQQGVYTDNDALGLLNDPNWYGFNDLTGMEFKEALHIDCIEKFKDHPLNQGFENKTQDHRQSFWHDVAIHLQATQPGVTALTSVVDYGQKEKADMTQGIFENSLGGRICINGHCPWKDFYTSSRQSQIRNVMRWLSKDTLPGYVESFDRANFWIREKDENGDFALAILNATFDPSDEMTIMLKTDKTQVVFYDRSCNPVIVESSSADGPYRRFVLPTVAAWDIVLVSTKLP